MGKAVAQRAGGPGSKEMFMLWTGSCQLTTYLSLETGFVVCLACLQSLRFLTVCFFPLQMAKLRSLFASTENEPPVPLVGNWRPPQPVKGRVVRASFKWGPGFALCRKENLPWRVACLSLVLCALSYFPTLWRKRRSHMKPQCLLTLSNPEAWISLLMFVITTFL